MVFSTSTKFQLAKHFATNGYVSRLSQKQRQLREIQYKLPNFQKEGEHY